MKVAFFTAGSLTIFGGFEKVLSTLINYLKDKGYEILICKLAELGEEVPRKEAWVEPYSSTQLKVIRYTVPKGHPRKLSEWTGSYQLIVENKELFKSLDVAVISAPLFVRAIRNYLNSVQSKAKIVTWFHMPLSYPFQVRNFLKRIVKYFCFKIFRTYTRQLRCADLHLAISSGMVEELKKYCKNAEIKLVYNPVLPDDYILSEPIRPSQKPIFVYVGRLDEFAKNLTFAFRGLARLPFDWRLKVIGTGPDEYSLKEYATKLGIHDKIDWLGFNSNPFEKLRDEGATALLLTSRFEGLPNVLIESIAYGIPVISASFGPAVYDIVLEGVNGLIYKAGDLSSFVRKLSSCAVSPKCGLDMKWARKTVEKFCCKNVCPRIENELHELLERSSQKD